MARRLHFSLGMSGASTIQAATGVPSGAGDRGLAAILAGTSAGGATLTGASGGKLNTGESFQTRWQASLAAIGAQQTGTSERTTPAGDASPAPSRPLPAAPALTFQANALGNRGQNAQTDATDATEEPAQAESAELENNGRGQMPLRDAALRPPTANLAIPAEEAATALRTGSAPANAASKDEKPARSSQQKSAAATEAASTAQAQAVSAAVDQAVLQQPIPLPNLPLSQPQPVSTNAEAGSAIPKADSEDRMTSPAARAVPEVLASFVSPAAMGAEQGSLKLSANVLAVDGNEVAPAAHSAPLKTLSSDPEEAGSRTAAQQPVSAAFAGSTGTAAPDASPISPESLRATARFAPDSGRTPAIGEEKAASAIGKRASATSTGASSVAAGAAGAVPDRTHSTQFIQSTQGADPSAAARDLAALRASQDSSHTAAASAAASGSATSTAAESGRATFTALDSNPDTNPDANAANGAATWTHLSARHAEAGYLDPALGWVGVRADLNGGAVHASLVPASAEAAQALSSHMGGLHSYLNDQHTPVDSLTLSSPEGQGGTMGGSSSGADGNGAGAQQQQTGEAAFSAGVPRFPATSSSGMGAQEALPMMPEGSHISLIA